MQKFNAKNLKSILWETLNGINGNQISVEQAQVMASTAREIIRTTNTQLRIAQQTMRDVPVSVISFSEEEEVDNKTNPAAVIKNEKQEGE